MEPLNALHEMCSVDSVESSRLPPQLCLSSPEPWATEYDQFPLDPSPLPSNYTLSSSTSSVDWELDEETDSSASSRDESISLTQSIERDQSDQCHEECDSEDSCFTNSRVQDDYLTDERKGKTCQHCRRRGRSRSQTHLIQKWRKFWFVLSAHSLRYYLDSGAEEAELVGEIDLTTCHQVTENQVQRNYAFQLHTHKQVYTLAAMTSGIRQNWIQALLKNIQNRNAPDVASLADNHLLQVEALCGPDVTQDSRCTQHCLEQQSSHNGSYEHGAKTCDWDEVGHIHHIIDQKSCRDQKWVDLQMEKEQEDDESRSRRRKREERRQRYAIVMGSLASPGEDSGSLDSSDQQQQRMREIEERWLQVERTAIREEKKVPLYPECTSKSAAELEKLLQQYRRREPTPGLEVQYKPQTMGSNKQNPVLTLSDKYQETKQLLQVENLRRQQIKNQLDLCPSSQFINEPDIKNECCVHCEMTFNKSGLASHAWCEASRAWEDEHSRAEVNGFSERTALAVKENTGSDSIVVKRFSQEAEFLARQNEALKQHNQELLNQLAEANREIDRLKGELSHQPNGCQPELESVMEHFTMELAMNGGKLQEARNKLAEMEKTLKDTQRALKLREATLRGLGFLNKDSENISSQEESDRLCRCKFNLPELESQIDLSEQTCRELQTQNVMLGESELLNGHRIIEAAYEQGFTLLKESHQKLTEDVLIKHQQEQELLQGEKERLLAEEAADTLIVIEAIKRAHCSELERVLQKVNLEKSNGDTSVADILKNHSEELASIQRELDVLSELYSQKCMESVHLAQALEAERKALCLCQDENLTLSTRTEELNNHLIEEVLRLSTTAKDGTSRPGDDRQQFELEIMLQVKESEVIYLQQEIQTLKNVLESAQTDQRLTIERYQEIQADHCMVKKKAEQQIEQLREHLRLAYEALAESLEKKTSATVLSAAHHTLLQS
ncbi:hypothetical protein NFI96_030693 [Prochilodus magdalenae]|nr:hypothetical protein NFI96_030693 [Prochilodus magdalenae]